jgi:thioredoxin reductase/NAD-dependent dihydropyrimidine dehydrogenase PreA subunit
LVVGDVIQIGPFFLYVGREGQALSIKVVYQPAVRIGDAEVQGDFIVQAQPFEFSSLSQITGLRGRNESNADYDAIDLFWEKRKREAGKIHTPSPLKPQERSLIASKVLYNWRPTRDLISPWPIGLATIASVLVLAIALLAAVARQYWSPYINPVLLTPYSLFVYGWPSVALILSTLAVGVVLRDTARCRRLLKESIFTPRKEERERVQLSTELLEKYDPDGPNYPHPVIVTERCIGCHACVDACPHDVLAIVNGFATPIASAQCMDDTSCQVECPVNPKACIVVNTTKKIPPRKVPTRDATSMTNVSGCYLIGDVSGTPLLKNAANEGADCIKHIVEELHSAPTEAKAELDVAIIGVGPAGLSAAVIARQAGLKYVGIEQDKVLATIDAYPANKYVFFKPETMESRGGIAVYGAGAERETLLELWTRTMRENGVIINENESCKSVKKAEDGDYFTIQTEKGAAKEKQIYRARRVVIALGARGTPMKLRLPGEEMKVTRDGREEDKVKYKLTDPEEYRRKKIIVVGAGNSAIEAAVDLVARRDGTQITFRPDEEINEVTLIIGSDLKNDLKFGNKQQVYDCIDEGKIKVYFGTSLKEIRDDEVVLRNSRTHEEKVTIKNDYIFAMIGGDRPTKFLESIGIKIG